MPTLVPNEQVTISYLYFPPTTWKQINGPVKSDEGLARVLIHWNLPGNPVDLEQREGRIHRYKGHAVRRNVAASHGLDAFASWSAGDDIWRLMFELADRAARAAGASDLVPHWIAPGEHRVQRHVPQLPYTTEIEAFERLKRQLAAYRVVFGQPRQEELVTLLDQSGLDVTRLRDWAVDLSPPATSQGY